MTRRKPWPALLLVMVSALPALARAESKSLVAVLDLTGNLKPDELAFYSGLLRGGVVAGGRYKVQSTQEMQRVVDAAKFNSSDCVKDCGVKAGELLQVARLVTGELRQTKDRRHRDPEPHEPRVGRGRGQRHRLLPRLRRGGRRRVAQVARRAARGGRRARPDSGCGRLGDETARAPGGSPSAESRAANVSIAAQATRESLIAGAYASSMESSCSSGGA